MEYKPTEGLAPKAKKKSLRPEENMSAWEYYNFLMRFGKRKMTRIEWVIWKMKKDEEDTQKGYVGKKGLLRRKDEFCRI